MMEYKVVTARGPQTLETEVNAKLAEGWKLTGDISVCATPSMDVRYTQVMTLERPILTTTWKPEPSVTGKPAVTDIYGNPVPDPVAPKSDQQKLIDVLAEIGIPHQTGAGDNGDSWVDLVSEGTLMFSEGSYTSVNFDHDGTFRNLD